MKKILIGMVCIVLALAVVLVACDKGYTVTFYPNYEGADPSTVQVKLSEGVTVPTPTREGYTFGGWYLDAACTQPAVLEDGVVRSAADLGLYAKWVAADEGKTDTPTDTTPTDTTPTDTTPTDTTPTDATPTDTTPTDATPTDTTPTDTTPTDPDPHTPVPGVAKLTSIRATYTGTVARGAMLDRDAIVVTAVYSDGTEREVSDYTLSCACACTNDNNTVTVSYTDGTQRECTMTYTLAPMAHYTALTPEGTIYFVNNRNWSHVYAYVWNGSGDTAQPKAEWPGEECTSAGVNGYGEAVFRYELGGNWQNVVFHNGSGTQSLDTPLSADANAYYPDSQEGDKWRLGTFTYVDAPVGTIQTYEFTDLGAWAKDGKKKIIVYLPAGYDTDTQRRYDVLYMFDGHKLFDAYEGNDTRWGVDTQLAAYGIDCIVVGIDNGEEGNWRNTQLTMDETTFGDLSALTRAGMAYGMPDETPLYQDGTLDAVGDWIRTGLMPYVAAHYRINEGRAHTRIAGSSSGGLAAFYLGLRDRDLYVSVGAFSPATGLFDLQSWAFYLQSDAAREATALYPQDMYIYCGKDNVIPEGQELDHYGELLENWLYDYGGTAGAKTLTALLEDYTAHGRVQTSFVDGATHHESAWRTAWAGYLAFAFGVEKQ